VTSGVAVSERQASRTSRETSVKRTLDKSMVHPGGTIPWYD